MNTDNNLMEKIVALCKRRGFIYPGSEIYGGLGGTWDYGPVGTELKKNLKDLWWKEMVRLREDMVGIDAAILMNPKVWEASGHTTAFTDPLVECKTCHLRFRADKEEEIKEHGESHTRGKGLPAGRQVEWTQPQHFNLLVKAYLGVVEGKQAEIFLRGEITGGAHVNFKNVLDSTRVRVPFGIAQIGKAFRNEITPGNFIFRSREFEQMEVQFYIKPDEREGKKWYEYWKQERMNWYLSLGIDKDKLRFKDHEQLAHYARVATDIEYKYPWGWDEVMGIHLRTQDLINHQKYSGQDMQFKDPETGQEYLPWDVETSAGVDRSILVLLLDAYHEEEGRVYLSLDPRLAPIKTAVFPLLANKPELVEKAREIYESLKPEMMVAWDDRGNIGGRYASQDEIGTPFCITIDFDTLKDEAVTVRDRNSTKQERVKINELNEYLLSRIKHTHQIKS